MKERVWWEGWEERVWREGCGGFGEKDTCKNIS